MVNTVLLIILHYQQKLKNLLTDLLFAIIMAMNQKILVKIFYFLTGLTLLVPFVVWGDLLYPFVAPRTLLLRAAVLLALPLYVYLISQNPKWRPNLKNPLNLAIIGFWIINLITSFTGANVIRSLFGNFERMGGTFHLLCLSLLYFYVLLLGKINAGWLQKFLKAWVWAAALVSLFGLWERLGLPLPYPDSYMPQRVSSTLGNPIFFASFLIFPIFLALFFFLSEEERLWRYVYGGFVLLQLLGVYISVTRGAAVGLLISVLVFGIVYLLKASKGKVKSYGLTVLAVLVILGGGLFLVKNHLPKGSLFYRLTNLNDSNSTSRLIQWKIAFRGIKDHPLLGVGPENYNVIANKYFDRELYKYDYSWFDKPHNYLIEILATNGVFGFGFYLLIIFTSFYAVFKAVKAELITWADASVLWAALLAYQIQNLFVFDTSAAAVMFFVFTGFCGYLLEESRSSEQKNQKQNNKNLAVGQGGVTFLGISYVAVAYVFYAAIICPIIILKDSNYASAYCDSSPDAAYNLFEKTELVPFNFDLGETSVQYEQCTIKASQDMADKLPAASINKLLDGAIASFEKTTSEVKNNPIYWFKLENLYAVKANFNKTDVSPKSEQAIENAINLAPNRIEPLFFKAQLYAVEHKKQEVIDLSQKIVDMVPENAEAKWRLALGYQDIGRSDDATKMAETALAQGYKFKLVKEIRWLINYYADHENYVKVALLYEQAIQINPNDYQLWANLATTYAKMGEKQKAIDAAQNVLRLSPESAQQVQQFINNLQ